MVNNLKQLQIGQTVSLERLESTCRITVVPASPAGVKVAEVGVDYVVLDDEAAGVKTQFPIHLISAIVVPSEAAAPTQAA
jgi:hypothetical protein